MSALHDRIGVAQEQRVQQLERRLQRERAARLDAEAIAERGLRELYQNQCRLKLLQKVTVAANSSVSLRHALHEGMEAICTDLEWVFGNAYAATDGGDRARAMDLWFSPEPSRIFDFIEASRIAEFAFGEGLPGRVLASGKAQWLEDTSTAEFFLRRELAAAAGLGSGFAFPITIGEEIVALFEFFSRKVIHPDQPLLEVMEQVGVQLGRVFERERNREVLLHEARHDALTGLPNRMELLDRINRAGAAQRDDGLLKIMVVDLDGLKSVNDQMGHHAGDQLIRVAARRLESCVAEHRYSLQGEGGTSCVARVGGDEFIVLLEGSVWRDEARSLAERMHTAFAKPEGLPAGVAGISASIGIAWLEGLGDLDQLVRDADVAMYAAKESGGSATVEFDERLGETFRYRNELEQELREGIRAGEFVLAFQPIVEAHDQNRIVGFEALVRWRNPRRGLMQPADFIPAAEGSGLILYLGDWVLEEACAAIARLNARGGHWADRYITVNVAAHQFLSASFSTRVGELIMRNGIDPRNLRLEITEGVAITDPERTRAVLEQIGEWGVKTSLDDFGTGYSSLSYLQRLPFDTIKIDKSFVSDLSDQRSRQILRTIVDLARSLDLTVVAEGVEDRAKGEQLAKLGCHFLQGYYFGWPLGEKEAFALL